MALIEKKTKELTGLTPEIIPYDELMAASEPVILKGVVKSWGLTQAGYTSSEAAIDYLKSFYNGKLLGTYWAGPEINGRFFYNEDATALNFTLKRSALNEVLDEIVTHLNDETPPARYVGSAVIESCLPGFRQENDLPLNHPMFANNAPRTGIWLGNPSLISAHYDSPNNIVCSAVGHRRFTLFPPEQIENLYPGPLDPTPGGQAISMVDFANPDYRRYPRFKQAVKAGQVADLEAGDALFYPSMWWHQVEGLAPFNVMVNYWWNTSPKFMGEPMNVLKNALLSIRDRPEHEKQAWKHVFDYYIFGPSEHAREHLPEASHGELGPIDDTQARRLRAYLINRLNR